MQLTYATRVVATIAMALAALVLIGWLLNIESLKTVLPGLASMKVNTAIAFFLCGAALYSLCMADAAVGWRRLGEAGAWLVLIIGGLTLVEYIFNINMGIDELFIADPETLSEDFPGRPSIATTLNFILTSIALLLIYSKQYRRFAIMPAVAVCTIATIALMGYLFNADSLRTIVFFNSMALHTALLFIMLGTTLLLIIPESNISLILLDNGSAGKLTRRLLPIAFILPAVIGWINIRLVLSSVLNPVITIAILSVLLLLVLLLAIWWNARAIHTAEVERRQMITEIISREQKFRVMFEQALDSIFILDGETGTILHVNQITELYFGYTQQEIIGQHLSILLIKTEEAEILARFRSSEEVFISQDLRHRDGSTIPMDLTAKVIPWEHDRAILVTLRDATVRRKLQEQKLEAELLRIQLQQERTLSEFKQNFLARVSHDFRTPLSVILSSNKLLELYDDRITIEKRQTHRERISQQVGFMVELLDDVIALDESQTGQLALNPQETHIATFCCQIYDNIMENQGQGHKVDFDCETVVDYRIIDQKLVNRILSNLVSNAVKYSPDGGKVHLHITYDQDESEIIFQVSDEGIGIPEADLAELFEPFHRAGNIGKIRGNGLGLAIVHDSVQLHNGRIDVESTVGQGTTFTVRLPEILMLNSGQQHPNHKTQKLSE